MIQNTERFKSDVKRYTEAIEQLPESQNKTEAKKLLNNLIYEVKNMDNMYLDMVYSRQLPSLGNGLREKITAIRKQLDNKLRTSN